MIFSLIAKLLDNLSLIWLISTHPATRDIKAIMIVILYQSRCYDAALQAEANLIEAFNDHVHVALVDTDNTDPWPAQPAWNDLLIVMFNTDQISEAGNAFIEEYLKNRPDTAMLLPVCIDSTSRKPPGSAVAIKALVYDDAAKGRDGRLVSRVGGMLHLRLEGRESKIFISYRATDGTKIATQLYNHLASLGYTVWLDEAKEIDGETEILPGSPVQTQINEALLAANLVLLIDTPAAPQSPWIKHEVDTANATLLPILPICFRNADDTKQGPRFRSLLALQRWVSLVNPNTVDDPLSADQLDKIAYEAEKYLCEIFSRKCRVPFLVKKEFMSQGFDWDVLDKHLLMFKASKTHNPRLRTQVLSHCSVFDQVYNPAFQRFGNYLQEVPRCNHSLFIYDGELIAESELAEIGRLDNDTVIILHHQELAALIGSNFTKLVAA